MTVSTRMGYMGTLMSSVGSYVSVIMQVQCGICGM